ncbi:MAG: hypothetical protein IJN04_03160 [Clostridia bacterium]|nr:hypothetical protein [Clostridia bacterium]
MKELDLRSFFLVLLQSLRLIIAVAVAMAVVFGVATGLLTKDTYSARCSMYIMNVSQQDNSTGISANGLEASQKIVNECIILIKSNNVMNEVAEQVNARGFDTTATAVRASVTMTAVEDTALLRIVAKTEDPELSQAICEELMEYVPSVVKIAMKDLVTINKIDDVEDATKNSPMIARNAILGGVFGLLLICGLILVRYLMDNTIKDEKDLKTRFNVNVLGVVMDTTGSVDKATAGTTKKTGGK